MDRSANRSKRRSNQEDENGKSKYFKSDAATCPQKQLTPSSTSIASIEGGEQNAKLTRQFYDVPCAQLATALLGKKLVRQVGTQRISGTVVETEAYLGAEDKAAHSYKGKRTERNEAMFMSPGTAYVYNIYGMYCCFNISSKGDGCAVLLRALEPMEGVEQMRMKRNLSAKKKLKDSDMANGPSKLCQALHISKDKCNKLDLTSSDELWLEDGYHVSPDNIVQCPRINIGYAEEWVDKLLRFYIKENVCVSVKYKG